MITLNTGFYKKDSIVNRIYEKYLQISKTKIFDDCSINFGDWKITFEHTNENIRNHITYDDLINGKIIYTEPVNIILSNKYQYGIFVSRKLEKSDSTNKLFSEICDFKK